MTRRILNLIAAACFSMGLLLSPTLITPKVRAINDDDRHVRLPDLIVNRQTLANEWIVRMENLPANFCSVIEGEVTPGDRALLRFTVNTPNIGTADLAVGDPNAHAAANDGLFEFATCHNHYHFRHYALYQLIDRRTGFAWRAAKKGFCMEDTQIYRRGHGDDDDDDDDSGGQVRSTPQFTECGFPGVPGNQGISVGWEDSYAWTFGGQYFVLDGGDGQPPVPHGRYIIRITVNPGFVPTAGEPCRFADPRRPGVCHQLPESNYENNVAEVFVTIPEHITSAGSGPLAGRP